MRRFLFHIAIIALLAAAGIAPPALAQLGDRPQAGPAAPPGPDPILFSADALTHDRDLGIVTATGNVEFSRGDTILLADTVSYNQREDLLSATGNVSILQPNGDVLFAEFVELSGDLKDGILRDIRVLLSDSSRIAAAGGRRSGGNRTEFRNAVYSPCRGCGSDPAGTPFWQIKARRVVHDETRQVIEYSDAWMEIFGIPVAYTPYFSHPDPRVRRKTGFLTPSIGGSSDLGTILRTPFFINIAPNRDATIIPILTTREGPILVGEYRERRANGNMTFEGSITRSAKVLNGPKKFRGHVKSKVRLDIDEIWRWGLDVNRSTDDTFLNRYGLGPGGTLTSNAFVEGFGDRNYMAINAYSFQNPRRRLPSGEPPNVLPMFEFSRVGKAGAFGQRTRIDVNALALSRVDDWDTKRLSVGGTWTLPYTAPAGDIYTLTAALRGDGYYVKDFPNSSGTKDFDGFAGRIWPQVSLDWKYPLARRTGTASQIIEPLVSVVVSPYGGNDDKIPNEDSLDFEFDENNLFSLSRFTGIDRVDGGPRLSYGLKWGLFGDRGSTTAMVGQSFRLKSDSTYADGSGLEENLSDFVGRIEVRPGKNLSLDYKARFDHDNLAPRRNEVGFALGPPALNLKTNYIFIDAQTGTEFSGREEISGTINARFDRFWRGSFSAVRDLNKETGGLRSVALNLTYECDCFIFNVALRRDFFQNKDLKPDGSIIFTLTFKTLGDARTGISKPSGTQK